MTKFEVIVAKCKGYQEKLEAGTITDVERAVYDQLWDWVEKKTSGRAFEFIMQLPLLTPAMRQ